MKKIFSLLLALMCTVGMWGTTVNFTTGNGKDISSNAGATKDGITITMTDGTSNTNTWSNASHVRLQAGGTIAVNPGTRTITSIVLNCTAADYIKTWSSSDESTVAIDDTKFTATWTGSTTSTIVLTNTATAQARIKSIDVTYSSGDPDPEPTKYTITISNSIANGKVTASASSAAAGTTITLTPKPDAGYELDSWSVTNASTSAAITVTSNKFTMPAANVNVSATFVATSTDPIVYSTGFESNEGFTASTSYYSEVSQGPASLQWTIYGSATTNEKNTGNQCIQMRISTSMNPSAVDAVYPYAFTNFTLPYVTAVEFYDRVSDNACIKKYKVQYSLNNGTSWNDAKEISAGSNSWAKKTVNIPEQSATMKIRFVISEYVKPGSTQKLSIDDVKIQTSAGKNVSIGSALYATLYLDYDVTIPENVSAYTATVEDGAFSLNAITGDKIKSNTAVVLKATTADDYNFVATVGATNMNSTLKGAATDMTAEQMAAANPGMGKFYALSLNKDGEASSVGFYWVENGGAAFSIKAGKAYLALPADELAPARFIFGQQDVPTEVVNVNDNNQSTKVLRDGSLYILRDGNLFDLNGRLVK